MAASQINGTDKDGNTIPLDAELDGGKYTPQHGSRDGAHVSIGAKSDAAAPNDTATASLIALTKLTNQHLTLHEAALALILAKIIAAPATEATLAALSAKLPASLGAKTGANSLSVAPNSDTPFPIVGNVAHDAVDSGNGVKVSLVANSSAPAAVSAGDRVDFWGTTAGAAVVAGISYTPADGVAKSAMSFPRANSTTALPQTSVGYFHNGTTLDLVVGSAAAGAVNKPFALPANDWSYTAGSGGILNTTAAVTVKSAAGSGLRNYITSIDISTDGVLTNATEVAIRDGAGGSVIWRMKISTAGLPGGRTIILPTPRRGTANTLLEVVTLTASGAGAVYVNVDGYSAP